MTRLLIALLAALLVLQALEPTALSRPRPARVRKALQEFRKGESHYQAGRYQRALRHYQRALRLARRPSIIFNIAQCYRFLDQPQEAIEHYELYLDEYSEQRDGAAPPNQAEVLEFIASLRRQLDGSQDAPPIPEPVIQPADEVPMASLHLTGVPAGARVFVDGEPQNLTGDFQLSLAPGRHELLVQAPGYRNWYQVFQLAAGERTGLVVELAPLPVERSLPWLIAGISGAALALGGEAAALVYTAKANKEYTTSDSFSTYRNVAITGHVVAGACLIFSAVSFYLYWSSGEQTQVALQPGPGGGLLSASFTF